jgi:hypothetical protein
MLTTQAGDTDAMTLWLEADEIQDSTLHDPGSDTSAVST